MTHPGKSENLAELYRETILRHAREPVGKDRDIEATHQHEEYNPQCGDRILIQLRVLDGILQEAAFKGEACTICLASASLFCEYTPGRTLARINLMCSGLRDELNGRAQSPNREPLVPELQALLGVKPYPSRIRCATLPWNAARKSLE